MTESTSSSTSRGIRRATAWPRLPASRPPWSSTWLDYFDTTGCEAFDAIVTDARHTPPGDPQPFVERRLRLAPLRFCYAAPDYAARSRSAAPGETAGRGLRGLPPLREDRPVGRSKAWAELLRRALGARRDQERRPERRARPRLSRRAPRGGRPAHGPGRTARRLAAPGNAGEYGDIDVALDTFPYNGGVTTLEALCMGRPVVAVEGDSLISRQSAAILRRRGLTELVARDARNMVELAASLAADPGAPLGVFPPGLRDRLSASPVCDAAAFTRRSKRPIGRRGAPGAPGRRSEIPR